jgi:hypothetical protein
MMRIRGGIVLRNSDIIRFDKATTTVTDSAITTAGFSCAVTARHEQLPRTCTVIGFSLLNGFVIIFLRLLLIAGLLSGRRYK